MSKITGTVRDLGAAYAVNSTIKFTYKSAPAVASGALVFSKTPVAAKIDSSGNFSATLVMGNYDVTIDDGPDHWIISVLDDTASYDIVGRITGTYTQNPSLTLVGSVPNASATVAGIVKLAKAITAGIGFVPVGYWAVADVTALKAVTTDLAGNTLAILTQPTGNMGMFYRWDSASVTADDAVNYLVIRPTDVGAGSPGRWIKLTLPVNAGGTGGTTAAGARTALGVPNIDDAYAMVNARSSRGGVFIDKDQATFKFTGAAGGLSTGLNDFSVQAVIQMKDWSVAGTSPVILASHSSGNNRWLFRLSNTGQVSIQFVDNAGTLTTYSATPDVAFVDGDIYSVGLSVARGGNATLYVNALSDRDFNGSGVTVSVAGSSAVDIGSGNANPVAGGLGLEGPIYSLRVFNRLLTANDFFLLHRLASPTWQEQFGSLTKYTSDFSAGADSFVAITTTVVTGNTDAIGGVNDTLLISSAAGTAAKAQRVIPLARKNGTRIKVTFDVYIPNTNATGVTLLLEGDVGTLAGFTLRSPASNTWVTYTETVDVTRDITVLQFILCTAAGASTVVTAGDKFYIKNVIVEYPGCIGDWDFESADPQISTGLIDKTGNLDLTMTAASCYQVRTIKQFNAQKIRCKEIKRTLLALTYAATVNIDWGSFTTPEDWRTLALTGNVTFADVTIEAGRELIIFIASDASIRNFTFPGGWVFVGAAAPASIAANKNAILKLRSTTAIASGIRAEYTVQP